MTPEDSIIPLELTDGCLLIDDSTLQIMQRCMRESAYAIGAKRKLMRDETALKWGGIMHKVLEMRYCGGATKITKAREQAMFDTAIREFSEWSPPEDDYRNLDRALQVIDDYNLTYSKEPFEIVPLKEFQGIETPFILPFTTLRIDDHIWIRDRASGDIFNQYVEYIPVYFMGRIDMVIKDELGLAVFDHKTTSIGGSNFFTPFYTATQFKGYAWAVEQILGERVTHAVINGIICRRPTRTGKGTEFVRDNNITYHPSHITEWKQTVEDTIKLYVSCVLEQNFPMQTFNCVHKFGKCEFYDVCQLPPETRLTMLKSGQYVNRTWNPIEEDREPITTNII